MDLATIRAAIDLVDDEIVRLLDERARRVEAAARHKAQVGLPFRDPAREAEIRARVAAGPGPFPPAARLRVFDEILGGGRARVITLGLAPITETR